MKKKKLPASRIVGIRLSEKSYKDISKIADGEKIALATMLRILIEKYLDTRKAA